MPPPGGGQRAAVLDPAHERGEGVAEFTLHRPPLGRVRLHRRFAHPDELDGDEEARGGVPRHPTREEPQHAQVVTVRWHHQRERRVRTWPGGALGG